MANYNNLDDIIAGVENATQLVVDTNYDDNSYTMEGVDWFTFNGNVCSSIYANGNSWIGLGASSENFKFNRQDAAMKNLWREEGTYLSSYRFLRIRWNGYSHFGCHQDTDIMTYDLILFDTGDIMLYAVLIPTTRYTGQFYLGNDSYIKPTEDSRYVTFYLQEDGSYNIAYEPISLGSLYSTKYLVRDRLNNIYTVNNGELIGVFGDLNANLFILYGCDDIPDPNLLLALELPEVMCWTDAEDLPKLTATVYGTPIGEYDIESDSIDISHSSIKGMDSVEVIASDGATFAISFDGLEYMVYDSTESKWTVSDVGMSVSELMSVPANAWSSMMNSAKSMMLRATIDGIDTVTEVRFNFKNGV